MIRVLQGAALALLLLSGCGGFWVAGGGGFVYFYDDDCDDHHDSYDCDDDYHYDDWSPYSVVATDFDRDGRTDLAVGDGLERVVWLLRGRDPAGVADAPMRRLWLDGVPAQIAAFRAAGDDDPGLLVLDAGSGDLETYAGDGAGGFEPFPAPPALVAFPAAARFAQGRIDGDETDDVVYVDSNGVVHVALGDGAGAFEETQAGGPASTFLGPDAATLLADAHVALAEFDDEPGLDLLVMDGARARFAVFSGRRDGTFGAAHVASFALAGDVLSIAPVTLEAGGRTQLAVLLGPRIDAAAESTLAVVRSSDGSLAVEGEVVGYARSIAAGDVDADGATEILVPDAIRGTIRTLHLERR